jgi:biopolymer transport protein ExbB
MTPVIQFLERGSWVMIVILALSTVLYARCVRLLLQQRRRNRSIQTIASQLGSQPVQAHELRTDIQAAFRQERRFLSAMVSAAPLLGLLGTVLGMEKTFNGLSQQGASGSMENLASGIAEVLITTESGLAVALPALLLIYLAHRQVQKQVQTINHYTREIPADAHR